jgi:toxin ParE1/3/4
MRDLGEIHAHISRDAPIAAAKFAAGFFDLFRLLAKNPLMGQARDDLRANLRSFTHGNYVVLFHPNDFGIEVAAVVHGARDVNEALGDL